MKRQGNMNILSKFTQRFDRDSERQREEGQVVVLFALMSFVLIGAMALSLDVGYLLTERRSAQAAADAAALAAAKGAMDGESWDAVRTTAINYGHANAGDSAGVAVANPPVSGHYAGDDDYYQVTITKEVPKFFLGVVYSGDWSVTASAVAKIGNDGFGAGILALNPDQGGIETHGSTRMHVDGGSIVSNFNYNTSGNTRITATDWIVANDGFQTSGSTLLQGGIGENPNAPEVADPLAELLQPPTLPAFPGNPVPTATDVGSPIPCPGQTPGWWPTPGPSDYFGTPGLYSGGGGGCITIQGVSGPEYVFPYGGYRFQNGAGVSLPYERVRMEGGTWIFQGGPGVSINGSTPYFEMTAGMYSFTGGATINIGGNAPDNILCGGSTSASDCHMYFSGGGGIETGGSNRLTLYPGTYIFDGGPGLTMSGNARLEFMPGTYEFWFGSGADMRFSGSSRVTLNGDPYVKSYFYGTQNNPSDFDMSGSTSFHVPSGEYYFDRGSMINTGSAAIIGEEVFLYFKNGGRVFSSGSASFAFTGIEEQIYPGFYPNVYMYSDRANTATFQWFGTTSTVSSGIVYLPSSPLVMGGASNGKAWRGQLIADRFQLSGSNSTEIEYVEHVAMQVPVIALVE